MVVKKNKILRYNDYNGIDLHYYAFDIDDNLFHMPTVIHMEKKIDNQWKPVDVSTSEFAKVRGDKENYRLLPGKLSFSEFTDNGPRGNRAFIEDMKMAISNNEFGPSWGAFIKCLTDGSIFCFITARGNEPSTYKKATEYIIDNVLTEEQQFLLYSNCLKHVYIFSFHDIESLDRLPKGVLSQTPLIQSYLNSCEYFGVSSESFSKKFGESSASNPEKAKEMALEYFVQKCNEYAKKIGAKSVSVGFSDDDPKNVDHINQYFKEKSALSYDLSHELKLNLYKTTDRTKKGGERTKFKSGEEIKFESSHQAWGTEGSVVPFLKWSNQTQWTHPDDRDVPTDDNHNAIKNKTGLATDMYKKFAYKRKK